jgi:acyl-CoA synthetase (AMP-forming)/AMP-acid ligase II
VPATFNLADLFEIVVDAVPEREALVAGDVRLTYRELEERSNRLAHVLAACGVGAGDHVAIYAWNRAEWVETWWASYKLRAIPINVNYRYVGDELRYVLANADVKAVVYEPEFAELLAEVAKDLPLLDVRLRLGEEYEAALAAESAEREFSPRSSDDVYMLYTGGTTGMPKGVVWRSEDIFYAALGGDGYGRGRIEDPYQLADRARAAVPARTVILPPLMHGAAQWGACNAFTGFLAGGTIVLYVEHRFDADQVWRLAAREKASGINVVGDAMARPLVDALDAHCAEYDLQALTAFGSGGAMLSPAVKTRIQAHLSSTRISDGYGSSETGAGGSPSDPTDSRSRFRLNDDTVVLDELLRPIEPGSGITGRLARSGHIPLGYYKDEIKTAETFPVAADGRRYVVPGDYATVDDDGVITLLGRGSQCINTGGEKVYPEEVETIIKEHPDVNDALVVGVPDARFTERVSAVVELRPGVSLTLDALRDHCRGRLAGYKLPAWLTIVPNVPRSPAGKADYRQAKDLASQASGEPSTGLGAR